MKTQFAAVYSQNTGRIRWILNPDDDSEIAAINLLQGEALVQFPFEQFGNHSVAQDLLTAQTGITPSNDRYAIVDENNNVQGAIIADPDGCNDSLDNMQLIAHPFAGPGWTYTPPVTSLGMGIQSDNTNSAQDNIDSVIANQTSDSPTYPDALGFSLPVDNSDSSDGGTS